MSSPNGIILINLMKWIAYMSCRDINELFGGATKGYEQIDITSGIDFYGEDETGNVIQAQ